MVTVIVCCFPCLVFISDVACIIADVVIVSISGLWRSGFRMANRKYRGRKCLTPGCDYKARCNGYCLHCYELMRYHERKKMENLSIIT